VGIFVFTGRYCGKGRTGSIFLFLYRKTTQCGSVAERKNHEEKNGFRMKPGRSAAGTPEAVEMVT